MVTRLENIFRMRSLLDEPFPNAPSFHNLFRQEISDEQDVLNAINNSGTPFATAETQINYSPNLSTYQLNVTNWGKVLVVVKATGNPYIPYLPVPFNDITEQQYGTIWQWWNSNYAQAFTLSETPERISFYREGTVNPRYMAKLAPLPQQTSTYIITYLPGYMGEDDPLEAGIQIPEHAELVRLRGSMAQLVYSRWYDDEEKNREKRKDLAQAFAYQLDRKEALFKAYLGNINIPRATEIEDWCGAY